MFARVPHASRSSRFQALSTAEVVSIIRERFDLVPVRIHQAGIRNDAESQRNGFQKHTVVLRNSRKEFIGGEEIPQVILSNAADGSSSWRMDAGIFRVVCSNGLVVAKQTQSMRIVHTAFEDNMREAVGRVVEMATAAHELALGKIESVQTWKSVDCPEPVKMRIAIRAHQLRFGLPEGAKADSLVCNPEAPVRPEYLLVSRRSEDADSSLWSVFNRVQENAVRGGMTDHARRSEVRRGGNRYRVPGALGSETDIAFNRAFWNVGERAYAYLAN